MSELRDILDKAFFHEGEGPNGSNGEFYLIDRDEYGNCIKLEQAILSWHRAELARVIGEDEELKPNALGEDYYSEIINHEKAEQRKRAGI